MKPFSYSRCATDIVEDALQPSLREASCCSVVVRNGGYGERRYGLDSTERTAYDVSCSPSTSASARDRSRWTVLPSAEDLSRPSGPKSEPRATRAPSTEVSLAGNIRCSCFEPASKVPSRSQYDACRKRIRSRSLSTTSRVATDCTRPAERPDMTFFHSTGETS